MNYKSFNLGDWIGHINGVIEDESELDGDEMRDLVEFLTTLKQEPCEDAINRQAAIDACLNGWNKDYKEIVEEIRILPPVTPQPKQQPCEDCISRQEVLDLINADWKYEGLEESINSLPPVTPQTKTAHWIDITNKNGTVIAVRCSRCEKSPKHAIKSDFCPNCGSKMVESQESEDKE